MVSCAIALSFLIIGYSIFFWCVHLDVLRSDILLPGSSGKASFPEPYSFLLPPFLHLLTMILYYRVLSEGYAIIEAPLTSWR